MQHELLSSSHSFNGQERETIPGARVMKVQAEARIFCTGDKASYLFYLLEGRVRLSGFPVNILSDKVIIVADLQAPALLSATALTEEKAHPADATAKTDCRVLLIPARHLPQIAQQNPDFFMEICSSLAQQHKKITEKYVFQATGNYLQKTAYVLLHIGDGKTYQAKQTEIAAHAGISRESINKALLLFKKNGWISKRGSSTKNGRIYTIEKPEELARLITGQFETTNT